MHTVGLGFYAEFKHMLFNRQHLKAGWTLCMHTANIHPEVCFPIIEHAFNKEKQKKIFIYLIDRYMEEMKREKENPNLSPRFVLVMYVKY